MATISDADFRRLLDQLNNIKRDVDDLKTKIPTSDSSSIRREISQLSDEYERLYNQINADYTLTTRQSSKLVDMSDDFDSSVKKINTSLTSTLTGLNSSVNNSKNIFDDFFGSVLQGLNQSRDDMQNITTATNNFTNVLTNFGGANTAFWREYHRRIREVGVQYGLSGDRLNEFRESNLELERQFVNTGLEITEFKDGIDGLYEKTGQVNQLTPDFAKNLGNISRVLGMSTGEVGRFMGSFNNLNVSFNTTTKILEDLRYSAEKSALNTNKVLKTFTDNFEKLNTYSFKNGVQGMMDMVKQSYALKVNMDAVLQLSDDFTDPEKTMEFASNMQLLGGSFSQLGDFNQLMYDAAVAPEELAKNIAKATASLGSFDRETGKFTLSFADRLQLKEASKAMGMSIEDMNKMAATAAKVSDIKMVLNFKGLSEEQYQVLGAMARFEGGEYKIDVGGETKSVATLSGEDIDKLAKAQEGQTFESLNVKKMDNVDIVAKSFTVAQWSTQDLFKGLGLENEKLKEQMGKTTTEGLNALHENIKLKLFKPMEDFVHEKIGDQVADVVKNVSDAIKELGNDISSVGKIIKESDIVKDIVKELTGGLNKTVGTEKKERGDILTASKFNEGNILKGRSHAEGGIPFTVNQIPGFEAEGGEVLLTKGVSQDPILLSLASRINEVGGGKKLFEYGDIIEKNNYSNITNNSFSNLMKSDMINNISRMKEINQLSTSLNNNFQRNMNMTTFTNTIQGGLIDKRGDIGGGTIGVNGSVTVDGKVSFEPIKITIEGTTATKEVMVNQEMQNKILSTIEDKIKNMNLYNLTYQSKGSGGINDGKRISTVDFA